MKGEDHDCWDELVHEMSDNPLTRYEGNRHECPCGERSFVMILENGHLRWEDVAELP